MSEPNEKDREELGTDENPIELFEGANYEDPDVTWVEDGEIVRDPEEEDEAEAEEPEELEAEAEDSEEQEEQEEQDEVEAEASDVEGEERTEAESEDTEEVTEEPAEADSVAPADGTEVVAEPEPLRFKADGNEFTVSGRQDDDGNYVIAPDEWQRTIQPRLADRGSWQRERDSYRRQIAELDPQNNPEVIRAREVTAAFKGLLDKGPDAVIEWAENYEANKELLMARAEAEAAKAEAQRIREAQEGANREEQTAELEAELDAGLDRVLEQAAEHAEYADLDMGYVKRILTPMKASIFFRAPHDMPEAGLKRGEIGMNVRRVEEVLKAEAERVSQFQATTKAAKAAEEAAKRNAAATGKSTTKKKAPPVTKTTVSETQEPVDDIVNKPAETMEDWEAKLKALSRS